MWRLPVAISVLLAGGPISPQSSDGGSSPTAPVYTPLWDLDELHGEAKGMFVVEHPDGLSTVVRFSTEHRYVEFATKKMVAGQVLAASTTNHTVAYEPTEVRMLGASKMAVGGYSSRGRTIIELWELGIPSQTGSESALEVGTPPVRVKDLVYEDDIPDERFVSGITELFGSETAFSVQFASTSNIYKVDLSNGTRTLVVSRDPGAPIVVADLFPYMAVETNHHAVHGHVYRFTVAELDDPPPLGIFLFDTVGDGEIDDYWVLSSQEAWHASPLSDWTLYFD